MKLLFDKFFQPRSVAIVGATIKPEKTGFAVLQNLTGFGGTVYPVNPKYNEVLGRKCHARLRDLPSLPDLAVLTTPPGSFPGLLEDCGRLGIGAALVLSAGGAGADGKQSRQLRELAARHNVRLLGPHSLGLQTPEHALNLTTVPVLPPPGRLALITESGALGAAILDWAVEKRVGFSHFVSVGFQADLSTEHLIDYFGSDSRTACIMIYLEHLQNARHFMSAARAFARSKPIVVLKPGVVPATLWGGGAIGADAVYDAAFRRTGIIRVQTIQQLFDCAQALATQPLPAGRRLGIVTNAGGPALLAVDNLLQRGGALAELSPATATKLSGIEPFPALTGAETGAATVRHNPVDLPGTATPEDYRAALHACLFDPGVDAVLTVLTPQAGTDAVAVAEAVASEAKAVFGKPVYASWMGQRHVLQGRARLEALRIPWYPFPERAVTVFMHMVRYRENLDLLYETPPDLPIAFPDIRRHEARQIVQRVREEGRTNLTEAESLALLASYGIASAPGIEVSGAAQYELLLTSEKDPVFGPAISLGLGGPAAAILPDRAVALPPLNLALARHLVGGTRLAAALPDRQEGALETALCRFAYLLMDIPGIRRVRIDPFRVSAGSVYAAQAAIELEATLPPQRSPYEHLAIQPYPTQWIRSVQLRDGTEVLLRPIRPEDEPLEVELARRASRESLYFRFFGYVPGLDHKAFARFTHIDYDREMAIVALAEKENGPEMIGVVRIVGDGWREAAEYAILVDDAWHGRGVGSLLTDYILEIARAQGYQRVHATFLKTNGAMRRLFERKGFTTKMGPDEADLAEIGI